MCTNTTRHPAPLTAAALIAAATLSFFSGCEVRTVESTSEPVAVPGEPTTDVATIPAPEPETAPGEPTTDVATIPAPEPET
ncbi:MAG: hypothetical protein ACPGJU_12115, partial [Coraliomargarita sp.]